MFLIPIAIGLAADYCLPAASACLAEYAGGTAIAGLLTGIVRGYNGSIFEPSVFDGIDPTASFLEKGGMCVGTALSLNLASVAKKGGTAACNAIANFVTKELTSAGTNVIATKVSKSFTWFSSSCARRTAISQTAQKSLKKIEGEVTKGGMRLCQQRSSHKISQLEGKLSEWLGQETKMIKNKVGDLVFLSKDMERRVRFDFIRPNPHNNPHMHIEKLIEYEWKGPRIYPIDVPHN